MNVLSLVSALFGHNRFFTHWIGVAEALKGHRQVFRFIRWPWLYRLLLQVLPDLMKFGKPSLSARATIDALLVECLGRAKNMGETECEVAEALVALYKERFSWVLKDAGFINQDPPLASRVYANCFWGLGMVMPLVDSPGALLDRYFLDAVPVPLVSGDVVRVEDKWYAEFLAENGAVGVGGPSMGLAMALADGRRAGKIPFLPGRIFAAGVQGGHRDPDRTILPIDDLECKIDSMLECGATFEVVVAEGQWAKFDGRTRVLRHRDPCLMTYSGARLVTLPTQFEEAVEWLRKREEYHQGRKSTHE